MAFCVNCSSEVSSAQASRCLAGNHTRKPVLALWAEADERPGVDGSSIRVLQREVLPGWRPWWVYWSQRAEEREDVKRRRGRGAMAVVR